MTSEQVWLAAALVAVVASVALLVAVRARARAARAEATAAALAERVALLESPLAVAPPPGVDDADVGTYVITGVATHAASEPVPVDPAAVATPIDGRLFVDVVARETVVKAASWTHGVRRALSAENRNRIRFQVRQETRRARRERRAETKQALREFRARQRGDLGGRIGEDVA